MSRFNVPMIGPKTPYNDKYETCERTMVTLRIYGKDLGPDDVSHRLGIPATNSQEVGQTFTNSIGRQRTATIGGWFLSSERAITSNDLRRHLDWLIERILPCSDALRELQGIEGVTMDVNCIWWSKSGDGGPTLWPEHMRALADLNLELGFDFAYYGKDEEERPTEKTPSTS